MTTDKHQFMTLFEAGMESNLPAAARAVFNVIAKRYNYKKEQATWVSHQRLADDTGFSVSTVKRAIPTLIEWGWVTVTEVKGKTSLYEPHIGRAYVVHSDLSLGHGDLPLVHGDLGGSSQWPTNGEGNGEPNGELNEEEQPAAPVANQEEEASPSPLSTNEVENSMDFKMMLKRLTPPLTNFEEGMVEEWRAEGLSDLEVYNKTVEYRKEEW